MNNQPKKSDKRAVVDLNAMKEGVSIIVFTYNSEQRITETLNAIAQIPLSDCPTEIIVVDNNSSDSTVEIAERLLNRQSRAFQVLHQPKPGLFYSRVAGIKAASLRYFIFVDDDNRLQGNWLISVCDVLNEKLQVGLIGGVNKEILQADEPEWWPSQRHSFAVGRANIETGLVNNAFAALWGAGLSGRTAPVRYLYSNAQFWLIGRTESTLLAGEDSELCYWMRLTGFAIYQSEMKLNHLIESRKITENYLLGIHKGFRVSDHYLLQYRIALTNANWYSQNIRYGILLKVKWLVCPIRMMMAKNKVQKLEVRTKTPSFNEVLSFWWNLFRWQKIYHTIVNQSAEIREEFKANKIQVSDNPTNRS